MPTFPQALGSPIPLTVMNMIMEMTGRPPRDGHELWLSVQRWGDGQTLELVMHRAGDDRGPIRIALAPKEAAALVALLSAGLSPDQAGIARPEVPDGA